MITDPFAGLPEQAVAVRSDATYLSVPSGVGVIRGMADPEFFTADGRPLGQIYLSGVYENSEEVGLFAGVPLLVQVSDRKRVLARHTPGCCLIW